MEFTEIAAELIKTQFRLKDEEIQSLKNRRSDLKHRLRVMVRYNQAVRNKSWDGQSFTKVFQENKMLTARILEFENEKK